MSIKVMLTCFCGIVNDDNVCNCIAFLSFKTKKQHFVKSFQLFRSHVENFRMQLTSINTGFLKFSTFFQHFLLKTNHGIIHPPHTRVWRPWNVGSVDMKTRYCWAENKVLLQWSSRYCQSEKSVLLKFKNPRKSRLRAVP